MRSIFIQVFIDVSSVRIMVIELSFIHVNFTIDFGVNHRAFALQIPVEALNR